MKDTELNRLLCEAPNLLDRGITISDAQAPGYPLIYVNPAFCRMTGYTEEELLGRNCRFLQGNVYNSANVRILEKVKQTKKEVQQDFLNFRKNGGSFWNRIGVTPVYDDEGILTHFICIQEDITGRIEREEEEKDLSDRAIIKKSMTLAEEKMRRQIGEELHDNISQIMAVSKLYLSMALKSKDRCNDFVLEAMKFLVKGIAELRQLSHVLAGDEMEKPLKESLQDLVVSFARTGIVKVTADINETAENLLSSSAKLACYRIVQEQLNNIITHAGATEVSIDLHTSGGKIQLNISDNGCGFDPAENVSGIGMRNMRHRAVQEEGSFELISSPGKGCTVSVELPVRELRATG